MHQAERVQLGIRLKGSSWVSGLKGSVGCQAERAQLGVRLKGSSWVSG